MQFWKTVFLGNSNNWKRKSNFYVNQICREFQFKHKESNSSKRERKKGCLGEEDLGLIGIGTLSRAVKPLRDMKSVTELAISCSEGDEAVGLNRGLIGDIMMVRALTIGLQNWAALYLLIKIGLPLF